MLKKVYCEIFSEYTWKDIFCLLFLIILFLMIGQDRGWGGSAYFLLWYGAIIGFKEGRVPNVYFYTPSDYSLQKYIKYRLGAEWSVLIGIIFFWQAVRYIVCVLNEPDYLSDICPIFWGIQFVLVMSMCILITSASVRKRLAGLEQFTVWSIVVLIIDIILIAVLEENLIHEKQGYLLQHIVFFAIGIAVITYTVYYLKATLKLIVGVEVHEA